MLEVAKICLNRDRSPEPPKGYDRSRGMSMTMPMHQGSMTMQTSSPAQHWAPASMPAFPPTAGSGAYPGSPQPPQQQFRPPPPPPPPPRDLSPVSAYVEGDCAREEIPIVAQLRSKNRELKARLDITQERVGYIPEVEARVSGHLERLRQALAESRALQAELARLQECLEQQNGVNGGSVMFDAGPQDGGQAEDESSHEQMCKAIQDEIDAITEENLNLINNGDTKVYELETELSAERRRQHIAQMSLRMPASFRSVANSPPAANNQEAAENIMTPEQEKEFSELEEKILRKEEELREFRLDAYDFEAETAKVLEMAQKLQVEEINRFRKMLEEKRQRVASAELPASNALEFVKAEHENLDSHVGSFKKESEQAHDQAMETAAELRREIASLRVEQGIAAANFEAAKVKIEEAKRASWESSAIAEREHTDLREKCEEVKKEIERSEMRVDFLSLKTTELEEEAIDLHQRSAAIMKSLPPMEPGVVEEVNAATEAKLSGPQKERSELQKRITTLRKRDTELNMVLVRAKEDYNVAMMQKDVMENKVKVLEDRAARLPRSVPDLAEIA
mmetsp:Transcript_98071/g.204562  ORF Transcript_98071/g.204562 Transcript_98071/m.204562 type:complete len:566 (-) Transcript_98071:208-1905(-)|eukprot:CAMPEP_0206456652 /NCGR_PEP_ID=MMETSP0324_2-20121206/22497_1 /ASSEMBLY_ACC=CAM_ASM_000836 /TAXON_ID=2866 /ORGANISM="Crypthecodinium cohnii, Strain Seligo" /LENGTH=565 /DNA_ID=CAMNT_0053927631 /DNA_START=66 /DNA_END=1763 /DNA_ORIENTATION=-